LRPSERRAKATGGPKRITEVYGRDPPGYCGPVGSRELVVVLDAVTGRPLWRYSYR
jgi:hypothetical protein